MPGKASLGLLLTATVAREPATFESGHWYAMRLEVVGDCALVSCNGVTMTGQHEKFALPKTILAIGTGPCPHEIHRLRVYEATRNPVWAPPVPSTPPPP